jgi:hypothetical protein
MRVKLSVVLLLLAALVWAAPTSAQEQTGALQGVVKDSSGGVLPGATVEAKNLSTGALLSTVTGSNGIFRFPSLPPGRYDVTATLQGFATAKTPGVVVALGQLLTVDLALGVASVSETVQVTGEVPLIDVKQNATASVIQSETIDRIPKGRDFTGVLAAAPGANSENRAGGISVDGASGAENRFVVDGMDTTNLQNGSSGKTFVTDFIAEVQVKAAGYNAEYPGATGGVVNAITKSGTNQFRGTASFYYSQEGPTGVGNKANGNFWKGKQRPTLRLNPAQTTVAEYVTYPLDEVPYSEPVFELGGPIAKDRLWFWGGFAPVRTHTTRTVTFASPVAGQPATQTFKRDDPVDRVTGTLSWQISSALRAKVSYAPTWGRSRGSIPGIEPNGTSTSNAATDYASTGNNSWNNVYSGLVDWVVKPNLFVNVSGGYFMYDTETLGNGTEIRHSMDGNISQFSGIPADLVQPSGYVDTKANSKTVTDKQTRLYFNGNATWFKNAAGSHAIKAGVRYERIGNDRNVGQVQPTITFHWGIPYVSTDGRELQGKYGYYDVTRNVLGIGNIHSDNWGVFLQDSWAPMSKLTINAGVRVESERIPFYTPGLEQDGIKFGFGDKIAPRVGFAYDIMGNGKWKAYGSFGRYYDITKLELPRGSLGGEQWHIYYYGLDTYNWKGINCQENDSACPGTKFEVSTLRFGSNEPNNPETVGVMNKYFGKTRNMIQDDIKPVQSQEFSFGLDHELSTVTSVGARYVHKWVSRTIEDFGWNEGGTEYYFIGNPGSGYIGGLGFLWGESDPAYTAAGYKPVALYSSANAGGVFHQVGPKRTYDALELTFKKRLANRWSGTAIYTYSRLYGNFPGLASSDEASTTTGTARLSPGVNRMYDGPWMMYDTNGKQVFGKLNTDRPHYIKLQGTYDMPWGTNIGLNWYARSGALFSKQLTYQGYGNIFYEGRGSLGRSPIEQMAELLVQQDFKLGKRARINLSLNVSNLFDNDVQVSMWQTPFRDGFSFAPIESFFKGWDPYASAVSRTTRPDPRMYGGVTPTKTVSNLQNMDPMTNIFLFKRDIRIGARISF